MDLNIIENLSEIQIMEMYDDVISSDEKINATITCYGLCVCKDGYSAYNSFSWPYNGQYASIMTEEMPRYDCPDGGWPSLGGWDVCRASNAPCKSGSNIYSVYMLYCRNK